MKIKITLTTLLTIATLAMMPMSAFSQNNDGDGRTDIAVYRDGICYIVQSSTGSISYQHFGLSSDIPVAAAGQ